MAETFFSSCGVHESRRKSEKNIFCLLCCLSVCPHCLPSHRSHPLLQLPYSYLTPLQAAVSVVQNGLRPIIPKQTHPKLTELLEKCWQQDPAQRPNFAEIIEMLIQLIHEVEGEEGQKDKHGGGYLSGLRKGRSRAIS